MKTDYHVLSAGDDLLHHLTQLTKIYRLAFTPLPYAKSEEEILDFAHSFPQHLKRGGFHMVIAEQLGEIIGFIYGQTTAEDHYWNRFVRSYLSPVKINFWLEDAFQLVEIALLPDVQGQGIGGKLHDILLVGLPHRTVVLTTMQADTNAYNLYKRRGWVTLVEELHPAGKPRVYRTMGLKLKQY